MLFTWDNESRRVAQVISFGSYKSKSDSYKGIKVTDC